MATPTILDSRDLAPYALGRFVFRFKWAEFDRCTMFYRGRRLGRTLTVRDEMRHSLAGDFRSQWESGQFDPESPFIRWGFSDIPGALEDWAHIARVANMGEGVAA
jgi:hypothetical protein